MNVIECRVRRANHKARPCLEMGFTHVAVTLAVGGDFKNPQYIAFRRDSCALTSFLHEIPGMAGTLWLGDGKILANLPD